MGVVLVFVVFLAWFVLVQMSGSLYMLEVVLVSYDLDGELLLELVEGVDQDVLSMLVYKYDLIFFIVFEVGEVDLIELDDYLVVNILESYLADLEDILNDLCVVFEVDWVEFNECISISLVMGEKLLGVNKKFGVNDFGILELWGFEVMVVNDLYWFLWQ